MALKIGLDILHLEIMLMKIILSNRFEKSWMSRWWNKSILSLFLFSMKSIMEIVIISWFYLTSDLQSSMLVGWGDWGGETLKTIYFHRLRSAVCLHSQHLALLHDQLFTFCFPYFKTILEVFKSFAKGLICWLKYLKLLFHKWCKLSKLF